MASGLKTFEIKLDNPTAIYEPGEIISGNVIVESTKTKSLRAIKLRFRGRAKVEWQESKGAGKNRRSVIYNGEEDYFLTDMYLLGSGDGRVEIVPGRHVFPFNFCLPREIPHSFEHEIGNIRYDIKAIMDRPWKFDHETTVIFSVVTVVNLNELPNTAIGIDDEEEVSFCGIIPCTNKGLMKVRIHLPATGFAAGELITASVGIDNNSPSINVTKVKFKLEQNIEFNARFPYGKTKKEKNIVQKSRKDGPFPKKAEIDVGMQVPSLVYSYSRYCSLINIEYRVNIEICVSGCHCSTEKKYSVVIGSRPSVIMANSDQNSRIPEFYGNIVSPSAPLDLSIFPSNQNSNTIYPPPYPLSVPPQNPPKSFEANPGMFLPSSGSTSTSFPQMPSPYPPNTNFQGIPDIGFRLPNPSAPAGAPELPPPSYEDAMSTETRK